jgi:hypothetical protein
VYDEGIIVDPATTFIDFIGTGVTASSPAPGAVEVRVPMITDDYGRYAMESQQVITQGISTVQFTNAWLDPYTRWDVGNRAWGLTIGVYEIGTNITVTRDGAPFAVRIVEIGVTNLTLAIANCLPSGQEQPNTIHLSTIIKIDKPTLIAIQIDMPSATGLVTIVGAYAGSGYTAFDGDNGSTKLSDFWYHRLTDFI